MTAPPPRPRRFGPPRFRTRLWVAFVGLFVLVTLGSVALALGEWTGFQALGVGIVVLALVVLAVRTIVKRLAEPVEQLSEATRRFGEGDLGHRIAVPERVARWARRRRARPRTQGTLDEMFQLGVAWNDMAERVERLVRGQQELLANVSHELRSPLARVRVALELVPRTADNDKRLADIALDLDELDRLIDDVLTASRLESRGLPARLERVEVAALLATLADRAALDPTVAGKAVVTQQSPGVTAVTADAALLRRALWNLIENAARYGAAPITVSVLPSLDGAGTCFSVADVGPGIPAALRARIFDPFVRADGHATRGFGLGLTIARRVAEVHGGSITLADTVSGTRFDLVIPVM